MKLAVFQTGLHTDMAGNVKNWTAADLDRIASRYDPTRHEAPAVIGHPKTDSPAWGWVDSLRRDGNLLIAGFKDLAPEFSGWLQDGRYKKRSICLYPDMTLKHVGFLGAMPPAVKGLPDAGFSEDAHDIIIEFSEKENIMELKEFFEGMKFWEAQKQVTVEGQPAANTAASFSEADIEAAKKQAAKEAADAERARLTLEFADKQRLSAQHARSEAIKAEVTQMVASGKLPPAWVKSGIVGFMQALDAETEIQFSETGSKQNPLDWFRSFLTDLPEMVSFKEIATRDTDMSGDPAEKIGGLIRKKQAENQTMSYAEALIAVQIENPDLASEYLAGR